MANLLNLNSCVALDLPLKVLDPVLGAVHLRRVTGVHGLRADTSQAPQLDHLRARRQPATQRVRSAFGVMPCGEFG